MSRTTKDATNPDDHSPSTPPPAAAAAAAAAASAASRGCPRQTTEGARSKSSAAELERTECDPIQETSSLQPPPIVDLLLKEDVDEEIDEKAKQQLLKETMETYREDFLNEHCERKLLWEEVSSLRQQVHLLLSELTTARKLVASQADELSLLKKQRNDLISILHGHKKEDAVDSDGEKRRMDKSASLPSSNDGFQSAWKCLICTFENPGERQTCCEVCGSLRSKDNETNKMTKSSTTSTGKLESDQVMKIKRRKCGKSGEHHVPSTLIYNILYAVESEKSNHQNIMSQKYTGGRPIVQSPYFKQIEPNIHPTHIR